MGFESSPQPGPPEYPESEEAKQEEVLTPDAAIKKLSSEMDEVEAERALSTEKGAFLERMTELLRTASKTEDPKSYKFFRSDPHFQKLKIRSKYLIENSFDRDLHEKVINYLDDIEIKTTEEDRGEIKEFFAARDFAKRKATFESYAQNGLLTLKTAADRGVVKETSSTPGDFSSSENLSDLSNDEFSNIRGYELTPEDINDSLFYGKNSFFRVALERGGEEIDRAESIPKAEAENRLKNSMIFILKTDNIEISRRTENVNKEDIVSRDIKPEEIDYLIVDQSNLPLAQKTFGHLPAKIIGADPVQADIEDLHNGPYQVPDYKKEIQDITKTEGRIWCHSARLPVDTYPS